MSLLYEGCQSASYKIPIFFLAENLKMLSLGLEINPNFAEKVKELPSYIKGNALPISMFHHLLKEVYSTCDHDEISINYFYAERIIIEEPLFEIISSHRFKSSEYFKSIMYNIEDLASLLMSDLSLICDEDEVQSLENEEYYDVLLKKFDGDTLELVLYYSENLSDIAITLITLRELLYQVSIELKEEKYESKYTVASK